MVPQSDSAPPGHSISDLLRDIVPQNRSEQFALDLYAREFERLRLRVVRILRMGQNCVVFELCDGNILKLTNTRRLAPGMGERPFEIPILTRRKWPRPYGQDIIYFIQPRAETPISDEQFAAFTAELARWNYRFSDPRRENVGIYRGRLTLLDPWAVCCPRPLSELLREVTDRDIRDAHDLEGYAEAFANSPFRAWRIIWAGADSVTFELTDGNVLKVTGNRTFRDDFGKRPFDLPILQQGIQRFPAAKVSRGRKHRRRYVRSPQACVEHGLLYFIQPRVETPVSKEQMAEFWNRVNASGYRFTDPAPNNLGIYQGQVMLIDPWAVSR